MTPFDLGADEQEGGVPTRDDNTTQDQLQQPAINLVREIGQLGKPGDVAGVAEREWLPAIVGTERRPRRVARAQLRGDVGERLVGGQGAASASAYV
jgi:hypothetical protein